MKLNTRKAVQSTDIPVKTLKLNNGIHLQHLQHTSVISLMNASIQVNSHLFQRQADITPVFKKVVKGSKENH